MSDQVVFTKEEVEKIREALSFADKLNFQVYGGSEPYDSAISILDSPRPRPNVPMVMICEMCDTSEEMEHDSNNWTRSNFLLAFQAIARMFGFDVED